MLFPAPGMPLIIQMGLDMTLATPSNTIGLGEVLCHALAGEAVLPARRSNWSGRSEIVTPYRLSPSAHARRDQLCVVAKLSHLRPIFLNQFEMRFRTCIQQGAGSYWQGCSVSRSYRCGRRARRVSGARSVRGYFVTLSLGLLQEFRISA